MVGTRIPYIRRRDGVIVGWCVCIKARDPRISKMGWPEPSGYWQWIEAA